MSAELLTSSKSWRTLRREIGERNASTTQDDTQGASGDFFDIKRPKLRYPEEFQRPVAPVSYNWAEPFAHLGKIGYKKNTYIFRGANKEDNNIYGAQHMKKTLWLEEMRRRLIAETQGISADVDETSIAGTAAAYYLGESPAPTSREKRNKYYNPPTGGRWKTSAPPNSNPNRNSSTQASRRS